jgi:hypothetical protein
MQLISCCGCQALQRRLRGLQAENECLHGKLDAATRAPTPDQVDEDESKISCYIAVIPIDYSFEPRSLTSI